MEESEWRKWRRRALRLRGYIVYFMITVIIIIRLYLWNLVSRVMIWGRPKRFIAGRFQGLNVAQDDA